MTQLKTIVLALASLVLTPSLALAQTHNNSTIGLALMNLNAATLKGSAHTLGDIWSRLRKDFRMGEVNPELVRLHEQYYANRSPYFNRTISRSQPYLYHIVSEVEKRKMPAEIALLPFIESAFVTKAKSHVGASGLWQFMPATGRHYGLEQTSLYDGRHDVYAATDAALNYLQYLHGLFGDWSLALAAYNWGEGSVSRAVSRAQAQGLDPVYENLRMPNETRNYVPKLLAVRNLINNPQAFGLNLANIDDKPYFGTVSINQPLDIQAAARLANISEDEFLKLNPSFKTPVFMPKANRKMLLPLASVSAFERNYRSANKTDLLSWDVYTAYNSTSLNDLAAKTGMSVSEIRRLNNISSNNIAAGRSLLLAKNSLSSGAAAFSRQVDDADPLLAQAMAKPAMAPVLTAAKTDDIVIRQSPPVAKIAAVPASATPVPESEPKTVTIPETEQATILTEAAALGNDVPMPVGTAPAGNDALGNLAQTAQIELSAREAVQNALTKADSEEASRHTRVTAAENARAKPVQTAAANRHHRVQSGDTLFSIAQRYKLNVADLASANKLKSNHIRQGQVLQVALNDSDKAGVRAVVGKGRRSAPQPASYTVRKGDTLNAIASRFNVSVAQLKKLNKTSNALKPGQRIKLTGL